MLFLINYTVIYWFFTFCSFTVYKANKDEKFLYFGKQSCCSRPGLYRYCQDWKVFLDSFQRKTVPICCDTEAWKRTRRRISKLHSCKASSIKQYVNYPSDENCTKSCDVGIYRYFGFFSIQGDIGPEKLQINFIIFLLYFARNLDTTILLLENVGFFLCFQILLDFAGFFWCWICLIYCWKLLVCFFLYLVGSVINAIIIIFHQAMSA